jgi:hypothetical protein
MPSNDGTYNVDVPLHWSLSLQQELFQTQNHLQWENAIWPNNNALDIKIYLWLSCSMENAPYVLTAT